MSNYITRKEVESLIKALRDEFYGCFKQLGVEGIKNLEDSTDEMPMPPKTSRKYLGSKTELRARIDSRLFNLLAAEAKQKSGRNVSLQIDKVLWGYYGKPKLSWEEDTNG